MSKRGEPRYSNYDPLTINEFLDLLRKEEDYWQGEQNNTRLMITRLRKIFYDKWGWDEHLIPQAAWVENRYRVDIVDEPEEGPEELLKKGAKKLRWHKTDHHKAPYRPKYRKVSYQSNDRVYGDSMEGETPEIYKYHRQEVVLSDGHYCDIAHTLAGLDALNHHDSVGLLRWRPNLYISPSVDSNADIVTWLGDIASSSADFLLAQKQNGKEPIGPEREQEFIDNDAPGSDMLGNIDAFVIGKNYKINTDNGQRVTEILEDYYLGNSSYRNFRFSSFCKAVELDWNGRYFSNESEWLRYYQKQLRDNICFQVYSIIGWKNKENFFQDMSLLFMIWFNQYEGTLKKGTLLKIWLEELKDNIIKYEQNGVIPS